MGTVGVREMKQNLSRYLRRAERGEVLTITDHMRPVARLVPAGGNGASLEERIADLEGRGLVGPKPPARALGPAIRPGRGGGLQEMLRADRDER